MLDLAETFVFDAVSHAYNLDSSNFRNERHARTSAEQLYAIFDEAMPAGYRPTHDAYFRDWSVEEVANMLFLESHTDMSTFHPIPVHAFHDGMVATEKAREAYEAWPERFLAYATVDPLRDGALEELQRQVETFDPIGLKLYPSSFGTDTHEGWHMDDPKVAYPVFERAKDLGLDTIAVHKALPLGAVPREPFDPADVDKPAENFPELDFEIVHGGLAFTEETAWQLARYDNIYVNLEGFGQLLAGQSAKAGEQLAALLSVGGENVIDQLFWGSGAMGAHPRPQLEAFRDFEFSTATRREVGLIGELPQLTDEHKRKILGENYAEFIGLDVEAARDRFAGDAFDQQVTADGLAAPYSLTDAEIKAEAEAT
jgi:hypothetical protein